MGAAPYSICLQLTVSPPISACRDDRPGWGHCARPAPCSLLHASLVAAVGRDDVSLALQSLCAGHDSSYLPLQVVEVWAHVGTACRCHCPELNMCLFAGYFGVRPCTTVMTPSVLGETAGLFLCSSTLPW